MATKDIKTGEFLFSEQSFVWSPTSAVEAAGELKHQTFCSECGRFFTSKLILAKTDSLSPCLCPSVPFPVPINISCLPCGAVYCSEVCKTHASVSHHSILCATTRGTNSLLGHQSCAAKIIAKVVIDLLESSVSHSTLEATVVEIEASMDRVTGQFYKPAYTRVIHSFRGGKVMPDSLFESAFRRSYFDGHLREGFEQLRQITFPSYGQLFLDTCITEQFYDNLMGLFMCNNQSVRIESDDVELFLEGTALYEMYSKSNHACVADFVNQPLTSIGGGVVGSSLSESTEENYERVGVNVFAAHDISSGAEIHGCYLKAGTGIHMSKKERSAELAQYLFICDCQLCADQKGEDEEETGDY